MNTTGQDHGEAERYRRTKLEIVRQQEELKRILPESPLLGMVQVEEGGISTSPDFGVSYGLMPEQAALEAYVEDVNRITHLNSKDSPGQKKLF